MPIEFLPGTAPIVVRGPFHTRWVAALLLTGIFLTFITIAGSLALRGTPPLLPPGEPIPPFLVSDLSGHPVGSDELHGTNAIFLFFKPSCRHCAAMIGRIHDIRASMPRGVQVIFVSLGSPGEIEGPYPEPADVSPVYFIDPSSARAILGVQSVPVILLVDRQGVLLEELVGEWPVLPLEHAIARAFADAHEG